MPLSESLQDFIRRESYNLSVKDIHLLTTIYIIVECLENPPEELVFSAALRLDHSLGLCMPNFDSGTNFLEYETEEDRQNRIKSKMDEVRKVLEEFAGTGYYSPERKEFYSNMMKGKENG